MSVSKVIFLCGLLTLPIINVQAFDVTGEILYTGTVSNHFTKSFHVSVDGCRWSISTWPKGTNGQKSTVSSAECDGTNVYRITQFSGEPHPFGRPRMNNGRIIVPTEPNPKSAPRNQGAVTIIPGQIPDFDGSFIASLWLAFASTCVLDQNGNEGDLKAMWATAPGKSAELAHALWDRSDGAPHLPKRVLFKALESGAFKARFQVIDFAQENEITYPTHAVLTQFATDPTIKSESGLRTLTTTEIQVSNFDAGQLFASIAVPSNSVVTDRRLPITSSNETAQYFSYFTTNGEIADPNQAKKSVQYGLVTGAKLAKSRSHNMRRYLVLLLIAAALIGPLALYFREKSNQKPGS